MQILGLILMGTSLDYESEDSRRRWCWNAPAILTPIIQTITMPEDTPDFRLEDDFCEMILDACIGNVTAETMEDDESEWPAAAFEIETDCTCGFQMSSARFYGCK